MVAGLAVVVVLVAEVGREPEQVVEEIPEVMQQQAAYYLKEEASSSEVLHFANRLLVEIDYCC